MAKSPFFIDWNDVEDVITYAKSLESPSFTQYVYKSRSRSNFNITMRMENIPMDSKVHYITGVGRIIPKEKI